MCFSATASFTASIVIAGIGVATLKKAKPARHALPYCSMPLIFAAHQFTEGMVWLDVAGYIPNALSQLFLYGYTFLAFAFWPAFVPLAMLAHEWPHYKKALGVLSALGLIFASYMIWSFTFYTPVTLGMNCNFNDCSTLYYVFDTPHFAKHDDLIYLFLAAFPFALSQNPRIRYLICPLFLLSFPLAKYLANSANFASVWCFIAAFISAAIYFSVRQKTACTTKKPVLKEQHE